MIFVSVGLRNNQIALREMLGNCFHLNIMENEDQTMQITSDGINHIVEVLGEPEMT